MNWICNELNWIVIFFEPRWIELNWYRTPRELNWTEWLSKSTVELNFLHNIFLHNLEKLEIFIFYIIFLHNGLHPWKLYLNYFFYIHNIDFFCSWVFGNFKLSITFFIKIGKIRDRHRWKALVETNLSVPVSYFSDFYEESYVYFY